MELTNRIRKIVAGLGDVKVRRETGWFIAEGTKCVSDTINYFKVVYLLATPAWLNDHGRLVSHVSDAIIAVPASELQRMSQLRTPQGVIAVYEQPEIEFDIKSCNQKLTLALDDVQDPGNLGTIIRVADWFGLDSILCSKGSVDVYNPKVVQATMGAIARIKVFYVDLPEVLGEMAQKVSVYGTFLDGKNIYAEKLPDRAVIVMGNEGNGISNAVKSKITHKLLIPSYPPTRPTSESLNVAMATGITLAEFRRQQSVK